MSSPITRSRDAAEWVQKNPILRNGEYGFEEDTGKLKRGDVIGQDVESKGPQPQPCPTCGGSGLIA